MDDDYASDSRVSPSPETAHRHIHVPHTTIGPTIDKPPPKKSAKKKKRKKTNKTINE